MKAIKIIQKGEAQIQEVETPRVPDGFVLVKVNTVGLNPSDWKIIDWFDFRGSRPGSDYAGVVEEVGVGVTNFKKGDRIAGIVRGGDQYKQDNGSFAEYIIADAGLQFKIPDNISDEEAATFGVAMATVAHGLYYLLGLPLPNAPAKTPFPILIYAGSTATGLYGIQYAKASGLTVVTTASPHNHEYLKSLGADAVFDYKSPTCGADIRALTGNKLKLAWDCSGDGGEICANALSDAEESRYLVISPVDPEVVHKINPKVDGPTLHLAWDVFGDPYLDIFFEEVPPKPEIRDFTVEFMKLSPGLLANGTIKPIRTIVNQGGSGLEGVLKGLDELRAGRVSAAKFVYTL